MASQGSHLFQVGKQYVIHW